MEDETLIHQSSWVEGQLELLSIEGINVKETRIEVGEGGRNETKRDKRKIGKMIKQKEVSPNLVLGVDIQIDGAMEVIEVTLVRRAKGKNYSSNYIIEWASKVWKEAPEPQFEVSTLARGWLMVKFSKGKTLEWVLN